MDPVPHPSDSATSRSRVHRVLFADEVYQENVYGDAPAFCSFKKVAISYLEMPLLQPALQLLLAISYLEMPLLQPALQLPL